MCLRRACPGGGQGEWGYQPGVYVPQGTFSSFSLQGQYNSCTFEVQNFKLLACFCDCTAWFVSDLVGTQIVGFITHRLILYCNTGI